MKARTVEKTSGIYYLQGVRETASGFKLNPDGSFQFFFTYGALDRFGSGTWTIENNLAVFTSKPWSKADFSISGSENSERDSILLKLTGGNSQLWRHVFFSLKEGVPGTWIQANEKGEAIFPIRPVMNITILFEFCPERYTRLTTLNSDHNYFEFRFEPSLMEVFFEAFPLKIEGNALSGKHPLLRGENYEYAKS